MNESGHLCERAPPFGRPCGSTVSCRSSKGALLDAHPGALRRLRCGCGLRTGFRRLDDGAAVPRPLERIAPVAVDLPRSASPSARGPSAVAAVLVVGVIAGGLVRGQVSHGSSTPHAVAVVASFETPDQPSAGLRRSALLNTRQLPRDGRRRAHLVRNRSRSIASVSWAVTPETDRWEALYAARTHGDVSEGIAAVLGLLGRAGT